MNVDLPNSTVVKALIGPIAQASNTANAGIDLQGLVGICAMTVSIGTKTIGDANGAITIFAMTSATNNVSNAVNYTISNVATNVATTNNTVNIGDIPIDTRNALRYLFAGVALTGTNSPSYPLCITVRGQKQVQP